MNCGIVVAVIGITAIAVVSIGIFMVVDAFSTKEKRNKYGVEK
jgi:hypothetical protein